MEDLIKKFVATFKVNSIDDISSAFLALKTAQIEGIIGENSRIELDGVSIPAGYFESATTVAGYFQAIKYGDMDYLINNLPNTEDARGYYDILNSAVGGIPLINRILNKAQMFCKLCENRFFYQATPGQVFSEQEKNIIVKDIALQLKGVMLKINYPDVPFDDEAPFGSDTSDIINIKRGL